MANMRPPQETFTQYDDPKDHKILHTPTRRVPLAEIQSKPIQDLIALLISQMRAAGIGLAANQLGYSKQIFTVEFVAESTRYGQPLDTVELQVFINPRIIKVSEARCSFWHGCLSAVRRDRGKVATYEWIEYEAYNEKSERITGRLTGMGAIIFQHEFRHMLGGVYAEIAEEFREQDDLREAILAGKEKIKDSCTHDIPHLLFDYQIGDTIEQYAAKKSKNQTGERLDGSRTI